MSKHSHFVFLSSVLLFMLLASLACPVTVQADDGAPPPPATEEAEGPATDGATQPPAQEQGGSEVEDPATGGAPAPVIEESVPPTEALVVPEPAVTEAPVAGNEGEDNEPVTAQETTVAEILEAAPEGTQVVVLDENGEALTLASVEAAEIVAIVDPMWCPQGVLPGGVGCTINFPTPQDLINDMDDTDPATLGHGFYERPGTIYFTSDPGGSFILVPGGLDDGGPASRLYEADYDALKPYHLTLQGGWNGISGVGYELIGQTDFVDSRVQIGTGANPWGGNITISNITISSDPLSEENMGLIVFTDGRVFLDNVHVQDNAIGAGANLNNASGNNNVIVRDSSFNGNGNDGLRVTSQGDIRLVRVNANENERYGAWLTTTAGQVTIVGSSTFDGNLNVGLLVGADGDITISNVLARDNRLAGAVLSNGSGDGSVSITSSRFIRNRGGLEVFSSGDITLSSVTANRNRWTGAEIYTTLGNIGIANSIFNANNEGGLSASSEAGSITLDNVHVDENLAIHTGEAPGANLSSFGPIQVTGSSFSRNSTIGLRADSINSLTLSNVTADDNALFGAMLSGSSISIDTGSFNRNGLMGIMAISQENIALDAVSASGNGVMGIFIGAGSDLVIRDSAFNENGIAGALLITGEAGFSGDATIICSDFKNNGTAGFGGFGVDGSAVDGIFTLNDVAFSGNDVNYMGTPIITSGGCKVVGGKSSKSSHSLPLHIVPVGGGEKVDLDCRGYSGTKLILPNGDNVILYCPVLDDAYLTGLTLEGLSNLPGGSTFVSGMEVKVTKGGDVRPNVGPNVIVSFVVPEDKIGSNFVILHWDGSAWTELGGAYADGYFTVETSLSGVFVLAIK